LQTHPALGLMTTVAEIFRSHADSDTPALLIEDRQVTYRELIEEASRCAALFDELRDQNRPPHIAVLLENVPDFLFWIAGAALCGATVSGINATYRGEQLGQLIRHTDNQLLVTSTGLTPLLEGADTGVADDRVLVVDDPTYTERVAAMPSALPDV